MIPHMGFVYLVIALLRVTKVKSERLGYIFIFLMCLDISFSGVIYPCSYFLLYNL